MARGRRYRPSSTCTISVLVPTLAPSITASAGISSTNPPVAKPVSMRPVAVLLCRQAVTPRPDRKPMTRLRRAPARISPSLGPKPR